MTPKELKEIRDSFNFTQKQMADVLGIHPNAYQRMEYGTSPVPQYIRNYTMCFKALNENRLFKKHIELIGVKLTKGGDDE
jgi:DNA-binding XRE family transcriptional regulator